MAERGNIAEFTSPIDSLNPDKGGQAAQELSSSARMEGALYRQAGEDVKHAGDELGAAVSQHEYMNEVSTGAATQAALFNNTTAAWNKIASQPGAASDPDLQKKFLNDTLEPQLQQFQNSFTTTKGQEWAMGEADRMRTDFFHKTSADMMTLAAHQREQDLVTVRNQSGATIAKDPTQTDAVMANFDSYIKQLSTDPAFASVEGTIKLKQLQTEGHDELAKEQVKAFADQGNFGAAKAALDAQGKNGNITPEWQSQLTGYIAAQKVVKEVQAQQVREQKQYKDQQANEQTTKNIFSSMAAGDVITPTTAFSAKGLSPAQRSAFVSPENGILKIPQKILTSPEYGEGFSATYKSMMDGNAVTPGGLTEGVRMNNINRHLAITPAGAAKLQDIQDKLKTPEGAHEVQMQNQALSDIESKMLPGGTYANDPKGKALYASIQNSFYTAWDTGIKAGKSPTELSDPNSKSYIGNAFTGGRSPAQAMSDIINAKPTAPAQSVVLPPVDKRVVGKTYSTAAGQRVWASDGKGNFGWASPTGAK